MVCFFEGLLATRARGAHHRGGTEHELIEAVKLLLAVAKRRRTPWIAAPEAREPH